MTESDSTPSRSAGDSSAERSASSLPPWLRWIAYANPFFYFINGLRHSMIGFSEAPLWLGAGLTVALAAVMFAIVLRLYSIGYGLRE